MKKKIVAVIRSCTIVLIFAASAAASITIVPWVAKTWWAYLATKIAPLPASRGITLETFGVILLAVSVPEITAIASFFFVFFAAYFYLIDGGGKRQALFERL